MSLAYQFNALSTPLQHLPKLHQAADYLALKESPTPRRFGVECLASQ